MTDEERFDRLLDAMVHKPPLKADDKDKPQDDDDKREDEAD